MRRRTQLERCIKSVIRMDVHIPMSSEVFSNEGIPCGDLRRSVTTFGDQQTYCGGYQMLWQPILILCRTEHDRPGIFEGTIERIGATFSPPPRSVDSVRECPKLKIVLIDPHCSSCPASSNPLPVGPRVVLTRLPMRPNVEPSRGPPKFTVILLDRTLQ